MNSESVVMAVRVKLPRNLAEEAARQFRGVIDELMVQADSPLLFDLYRVPAWDSQTGTPPESRLDLGYDEPIEPSKSYDPWED